MLERLQSASCHVDERATTTSPPAAAPSTPPPRTTTDHPFPPGPIADPPSTAPPALPATARAVDVSRAAGARERPLHRLGAGPKLADVTAVTKHDGLGYEERMRLAEAAARERALSAAVARCAAITACSYHGDALITCDKRTISTPESRSNHVAITHESHGDHMVITW